jgi:hypothetical protein
VVQNVTETVATETGIEQIGVRQVRGDKRRDRGDRAEARRGLRTSKPDAEPHRRLGEEQTGERVGDVVHVVVAA